MKYSLFFFLALAVNRCNDKSDAPRQPEIYKLNVEFVDCTGCLDVMVIDSAYRLPEGIADSVTNPNIKFLLLRGKNPFQNKMITNRIFKHKVELEGFFAGTDSNSSTLGRVPVFYVKKWKKKGKR